MKNNLIIATVCLIIGGIAGFKLVKPETKTVEVEKEVIKRDVVTQIKVVTKPDGSKEEVTLITDRSTENKESSKSVTVAKPDWHVSAGATVNSISDKLPVYQLTVERRIFSDFTVGVTARSDKSAGFVVGFSF